MKKYVGPYIGQPTPTIDAFEKVTGSAQFADDLTFPGLLYGAVLTSPVAHARIKSIDASAAQALPGVCAVITHEDAPKGCFNRIMRWSRDPLPATERVLDEVVRFVGDEVAAVAATSEEIARKAVKLIRVEYEPLPSVFDPEEALAENAPRLYPEGNLLQELLTECGDLDKALHEAEVRVENLTETAMIHHGAIEPHLCIAQWSRSGELEVWEPQQGVHRVQVMLSQIFGVPFTKIHLHNGLIGGTFGGKDGVLLQPLCLLLSKKAGHLPVKIRYNRAESIVSTYTRHAVRLYGQMALTREGLITGFGFTNYMNAGPYCGGSINVMNAMCGKMFKVYASPSMRFHGYNVYTNTPVGGAMRGFGSPKIFTALELLVNKAARALNMDPVLLREKNLIEPFGAEPVHGDSLGSAQVRECLAQGAKAFGWKEKWAARKSLNTERYLYGYGVSTAMHGKGVAPFAPDITLAELMLNEDGSFLLRTAVTDHGAGTYTLLRQIVSEVMGCPLEEVFLVHSDTDSCNYDMGSGASRNTWSGGAAVETVARQLLDTMLDTAAAALECSPQALRFENGVVAGPGGISLTRAEISSYAYEKQRTRLIELARYNSDTNAGSYGAHFAKVRIDRETGEVKVEDYLAMCDIGTPLNPLLLEGQIEGAIMMGLGMALFEAVVLDENGVPKTTNLKKYRLPKASDMPHIDVQFVDNFEEGGPFGGKSVGESSIVPVVPAIVGAVNDALDADLGQLPLTPDKILAVLQQ